ncbi:hypothetical protein DFJ58DRAFT_914171 [Suillus subalutaceus]|uniref:uncharacterized protein n=1 Tax=Suillus subalutaceus TaxID=48586 RepID=UPI001B87D47C|nr:uncharacterized protein DFJ58DRAFT_914171 [Suillus subalutaceus]KAG1853707.1 hypothetical protein DFJ58DRAFT_914171 [Suillus subalutaceus]
MPCVRTAMGKSQPLKFYFFDPSRGRCPKRRRAQATLKLDGFVYHSFDGPAKSPAAVNDTAIVESTSTDAQDKPATEGDHSGSHSNSEIVGVRSDPLRSLVVDRVWHVDPSFPFYGIPSLELDRRAILEPVVQHVVDALGGYEGGAYRMGDEAALLTPGIMQDLFGIVLPPISKHAKERKERGEQIVHLVLHLIWNLIKDFPANTYLSTDQGEYSSLQARLVKVH